MKGKIFAILIHCAGTAIAMAIVLACVNLLAGSVSENILTASTVFYLASVAWITVRVFRGQDEKANAAAAFINRKK